MEIEFDSCLLFLTFISFPFILYIFKNVCLWTCYGIFNTHLSGRDCFISGIGKNNLIMLTWILVSKMFHNHSGSLPIFFIYFFRILKQKKKHRKKKKLMNKKQMHQHFIGAGLHWTKTLLILEFMNLQESKVYH